MSGFGGGGGGGRFGGGGGGRGRGRYGNRTQPQGGQNQQSPTENPAYNICRFFAQGSCQNNNCRFAHNILTVASGIPAHQAPVTGLGVLSDGPKVITGSTDSTVKVWSLGDQPRCDATIPVAGPVTTVEVANGIIMWAVNFPIIEDITVGVVHLLNTSTSDFQTYPIKRSEDMPYTDSMGNITSISIKSTDSGMFVITGGGEGVIRVWKFDVTKLCFELFAAPMEGHLRQVTSLLLVDTLLWSASADQTIRVWDMGTNKCVGVLTSGNGGHTKAVSCLTYIPAPQGGEAYIASGGIDCEVKLWKASTGDFAGSASHPAMVTTMCYFQDSNGSVPMLLIGHENGTISVRSCQNLAVGMQLLFFIDSGVCKTKNIKAIASLGGSFFASTGEDGNVVIWQINSQIREKS